MRASDEVVIHRALDEAEVIAIRGLHVDDVRVGDDLFHWNIQMDMSLHSVVHQ